MRILVRPWEESSYTQYAQGAIRYFWITIWTHAMASCWTCTMCSCWLLLSFTLTSKSCLGVRSIFNLWLFAISHLFLTVNPVGKDWIWFIHCLVSVRLSLKLRVQLISVANPRRTAGSTDFASDHVTRKRLIGAKYRGLGTRKTINWRTKN